MKKILFLTALLLSGCEWWQVSTPPPEQSLSAVAPSPQATPTPSAPELPELSNVAIKWRAPNETVEGFIFYYGHAAKKLDYERRVPLSDIEIVSEGPAGRVYRYILESVEANGPLFVSIASYQGATTSPPSAPMEVRR